MALRYDPFSFMLICSLQQALRRSPQDLEDASEDEIASDSQGDKDVNCQDDEDINTQDEEVITDPLELMEDSAAGDVMNEDFDYTVQRISDAESIAPETDADNEDLFDGPIGMISLYLQCSSF